jgi:hypothetical protein
MDALDRALERGRLWARLWLAFFFSHFSCGLSRELGACRDEISLRVCNVDRSLYERDRWAVLASILQCFCASAVAEGIRVAKTESRKMCIRCYALMQQAVADFIRRFWCLFRAEIESLVWIEKVGKNTICFSFVCLRHCGIRTGLETRRTSPIRCLLNQLFTLC